MMSTLNYSGDHRDGEVYLCVLVCAGYVHCLCTCIHVHAIVYMHVEGMCMVVCACM